MSGDRPDQDEIRRLRDLSRKATKRGDVIADSESSQESVEEQKSDSHGSFLRGILTEARGEIKSTAPPKKDQKDQKTKTSQKQQEPHPSTDPVEPFKDHTNDQRATGRTSVGLCDENHVRLRCHWSYYDSTNSESSWRLEQVNFTRDDNTAREAHRKCALRRSSQLLDSLARYMREDLEKWFERQGRRLTLTSPPTVANIRDALRPLVTQFLNDLSGIGSITAFAPPRETPAQARARVDYIHKHRMEAEERAKANKLAIARQAEKQEAAQRKHNEKDIKERARGRVTIKPRPAVAPKVSKEDKKTIEAIRRAGRAEAKKADQQEKEEEKKQRQKAAAKEPTSIKSQKLKTITKGSQESSRSPSPWNDRLRSSRRSRPIVRDSEDSDSVSPTRPSKPSRPTRSTSTKIQDSDDSDSVKTPRSSKVSPSTKKAPVKTSESVASSADQPAAKKATKAYASTADKTTKVGESKKSTPTPTETKTKETTQTTKATRSSETKVSDINKSTESVSEGNFEAQVLAAFGGSTATAEEATTSTPAGPVDADAGATIEAATRSVEIKQQDTKNEMSEVTDTTEAVESGSEEGEIVVNNVSHTGTATASAPTESQPSRTSPVPSPKSAAEHESDCETVSSTTSSSSSATKRKRAAAAEEADSGPDTSSQRGATPSPPKKRRTVTPPDSPTAVTTSPVLINALETAAPPSEAGSLRSSKSSSSSKKRKATWTEEDGEITISPSRMKRSRSEDETTDQAPGSGAAENGADDPARPPEPSEGDTLVDRLRAQGWTEEQIAALAGELGGKGK